MPTGYTGDVTEKTTFAAFAMNCARAFGALVTMREDPHDAPIPDESMPSTYNAERLAESEARYAHLKAMTLADAGAEASKEYAKTCEDRARRRLKTADQRIVFERLAAEVREWEPPTPDHFGLKAFMLEQISVTVDGDLLSDDAFDRCYPEPKLLTGEAWRGRELDSASRDIRYHRDAHAKELERTAMRNGWIKALRTSLGGTGLAPGEASK